MCVSACRFLSLNKKKQKETIKDKCLIVFI
uniref:Uncharacterized protein n=1 Tax=Anguilla anguilla TaxID=7936 RepID=A0A0E9SY73_ANGAN